MTKVRISPLLFAYQQDIAERVAEVCEENAEERLLHPRDDQISLLRTDGVELHIPGLLHPPRIELLWPDFYLKNGCLDGIIQISTSEYFGVTDVFVSLEDARGNLLESDYAMENDFMENHWGYIPSVPASPGAVIVVRAVAIDALGGFAVKTQTITV